LFAASVLVLAVWLLLLPSRAAIAKGLGGDRVPE